MPEDVRLPCALTLLPANPTNADYDRTFIARGVDLADCERKRRLAVGVHDREHGLEAEAAKRGK